jgi:benzylsuccinate CoA-transferase BbsF subunit
LGTGTNYPDHVPNPLHAAIAVLAALRRRRKTGQGEYIELSQLESTVNAIGPTLLEEQMTPGGFIRKGNYDRSYAPHGVYQCAGDDRWCAIAVANDAEWRILCHGIPGLESRLDPRFSRHDFRSTHREDMDRAISALTVSMDAKNLTALLSQRGVAAAPVLDARDLLSNPQLLSRKHWVTLDHAEMGPSVYDAPPYRLSRTPGHLSAPAPLLGADSRDVALELLGLTDAEFNTLRDEGIMG